MVSCDYPCASNQNRNTAAALNKNSLKTLYDYITRFTLLAGNLLLEGSRKENIVFSPLNIFHSFSLIYLGSVGETRNELSSIFGFPEDSENTCTSTFHQKFADFLRSLQSSKSITLNSAVGIFVQNKFNIDRTWAVSAKTIYNNQVLNIDFSNSTTTKCINNLISSKTKGNIGEFLSRPLDVNADLLLISALHFTSEWQYGFDKMCTKKETFCTGSSTIDVEMMSQQQRVQYLDDPKLSFRVLGLSYKNDDFCLYIQLPREAPEFADYSNNFEAVYLNSFVDPSALSRRHVYYKIPRFRLTTVLGLNDVLVNFGSKHIVSSPTLDGMLKERLDIVEIKHGASIDFGDTEATLANASQSSSGSSHSGPPMVKFFVDKPFTFFVYHRPTKITVLAGAVTSPGF